MEVEPDLDGYSGVILVERHNGMYEQYPGLVAGLEGDPVQLRVWAELAAWTVTFPFASDPTDVTLHLPRPYVPSGTGPAECGSRAHDLVEHLVNQPETLDRLCPGCAEAQPELAHQLAAPVAIATLARRALAWRDRAPTALEAWGTLRDVHAALQARWVWPGGDGPHRWARSYADTLADRLEELRRREQPEWERAWLHQAARDLVGRCGEVDPELERLGTATRVATLRSCYLASATDVVAWRGGEDLSVSQVPDELGERRDGESAAQWLAREWEQRCATLTGRQLGEWDALCAQLESLGVEPEVELSEVPESPYGLAGSLPAVWGASGGCHRVPLLAAVWVQRSHRKLGPWQRWAAPMAARAEMALRLEQVPLGGLVPLVEASLNGPLPAS